MSTPEDIPEDREESYACHVCGTGNITLNNETGYWECDECGFSQSDGSANGQQ